MCKKNVLTIAAVAILALAIGQVQAVTVTVPNSDFELIYKPGSTTITATLSPVGGSWTQGVGPDCPIGLEVGLEVGEYEFSDTSTGTVADIPGWLGYDRDGWIDWGGTYGRDETTGNLQGSVVNQIKHTPGGLNCYVANGGQWQNPAGGMIVSEASLGYAQDGIYVLAAKIRETSQAAGKAEPVRLDLLAVSPGQEPDDDDVLTPSSSVDPVLTEDWQLCSRTYELSGLSGKELKIVVGIDRDAIGGQTCFDDVSLSYYVALPPGQATNPNPADVATDVCPKVVLSWTPGPFVGALSPKHKVFLSENFDDVNDGVGGVTHDPNRYPATGTLSLDFGKTYYWKVDEANSTTGWDEGGIWQFTTGPIAYPIAGDKITAATASSSKAADEGPENTINGSGLNANDLHSTVETDMWLSGSHQPGEAWIKYEFDKVYKLHEMWVWNYNTGMEDVLGYGLKDVTIEYSENGNDYTTLGGTTHEFARAPGAPGYEHNTEVPLEGVVAKYVRLTANSNWAGIFDKYGLSEVRFFCIPVRAREPNPEDGTTGVWPDVVLRWKAGRDAAEHYVYFSTSFEDVNTGTIAPDIIDAAGECEASYGPLSLEFGKTYYWRIDEVEADSVTVHRGKVWSFRTKLFIPIIDPNLIGWWKLDEGEGTVALDWSGHDNHGVLFGDPLWVAGIIGDALDFDGADDYVNIDGYKGILAVGGVQQPFTIANWFRTTGNGEMVTWGTNTGRKRLSWRIDGGTLRTEHGAGNLRGNTSVNDGEWHHGALVVNEGANLRVPNTLLYVDGVQDSTFSGSNNPYELMAGVDVRIGMGGPTGGRFLPGAIDDVRIYDKALTEAEIMDVMRIDRRLAWNPNPRDKAGVSFELAALSWSPGDEAVSHDVYFGTDEAAVASATLASPEFKANQTDTTYPLAELEMETTYYWRIDEVSDADTWKGDTWSFTTGKVYYVDADAEGANDGSSWADAYWCLRNALTDAQAGDEIRVAEGMYRPDRRVVIGRWPIIVASGDREATFQLKNGVAIKGGYAGFGEPDPNARDIDAYETILSGDLNGDDVDVAEPGDLWDEPTRAENSYHVVTGSGTNATAVLDGFTITGGNANGEGHYRGGGMFNNSGSPTVTNCTFSGNWAYQGGGMRNDEDSSPMVTNCTFSENSARYGGGGMENEFSSPMVTNCTFSGNSVEQAGGGMVNEHGNPTVTNCTFSGNSVRDRGGGMANFTSSPTITNCTFSGNSAYEGGGMYNYYSSLTVTNCTFSGNSASESGGGIYNEASSPALTNCILWDNSDSSGMDKLAQISGAAILNYCCIQGYVEPNEPNEPPTQGLISHWKFDEGEGTVAQDSSGHNNHGTLVGDPLWVAGVIGEALELDGVDDYVVVGSVGISGAAPRTIAGWAKANTMGVRDWTNIFGFTSERGWGLQFDIEKWGFGGDYAIHVYGWERAIMPLDLEWHHLAATYDGTTIKWYGDCLLVGSEDMGLNTIDNVHMGKRGDENNCFPGLIDDVRIYERALSVEEILQFYLRGFGENQGNIDSDPWFVEPGYWDANGVWVDGDYHLLPGSPCINAGDPNYIAEPNETDLDGKPRVIGGRIDMGAYEYPNTTPVACIVGSNRIVEAQGPFGARITLDGSCSSDADSAPGTNDDIVSFDWYKVDACDPNFEDFLASGEIIDCNLPLGEHIIVLEVTDKSGAFDTNEVTIIVQDTTPPDFMLSVTPTTLWPANHKMVEIRPSWTASDICDDSPEVSLVSITMNEDDEAKGDGNTAGDIQIGDDGSIYLRAERSGTGSGRIYTITYQAVDDSGNAAVARATVTVPHDQR